MGGRGRARSLVQSKGRRQLPRQSVRASLGLCALIAPSGCLYKSPTKRINPEGTRCLGRITEAGVAAIIMAAPGVRPPAVVAGAVDRVGQAAVTRRTSRIFSIVAVTSSRAAFPVV